MLIDRQSFFVLGLVTLLAGLPAFAADNWQAVEIQGHRCVQNKTGDDITATVCSQYGGGDAMADPITHEVMCGKGHCLKDNSKKGVVLCSKQVNGVTTYDDHGGVVCSGGCEPASKVACEKLTP